MPSFEFTSPEGKKYTVEGPEGATQEQAFQMLQGQLSAPQKSETTLGFAPGFKKLSGDEKTTLGTPGQLAEFGFDVATAGIGGGAGGILGKSLTGAARSSAEWAMQSAIKPIWMKVRTGEAATAVRTMLEEGIPATKEGMAKLRGKIDSLNTAIKGVIASSTSTVNKSAIARHLERRIEYLKKQVLNQDNVAKAEKVLNDFLEDPNLPSITPERVIPEKTVASKILGPSGKPIEKVIPERIIPKKGTEQIPIQEAQTQKQGLYRKITERGYDPTLKHAEETQSEKAIARGYKEEIARVHPILRPLNAKESEMLKTLSTAERKVLMDANKNPVSFGALVANPLKVGLWMADRSPAFKSYVALKLYQVSKNPEFLRMAGATAGIGAGEVGQRALSAPSDR
jgi:hypothetical protein